MSDLPDVPRRGFLQLNGRVADTVANGFDWLFRRERLIQSGRTHFRLILDGELMSVRRYDAPEDAFIELPNGERLAVNRKLYAVPLVLVPPLGVTADTFDLMPSRSLARYMAARGFRTYLIDWGRPTPQHASLGIADYVDTMMSEALTAIRRDSGSKEISLFGWCMGGLLSLMHAGLTQDRNLRNLVTVASPIDLRGGGVVAGLAGALDAPARLVRKYSDFRLMGVDPQKLTIPGWLLALGFKMTSPIASITTYWDLMTQLWDREFVEKHSTTSNYLNRMLIYPGGVVRDMLLRMAIDNELATGRIRIDDRIAEVSKIKASALIFAGDRDTIVAPSIARKIVDLLPTKDKSWRLASGGHMGVVLGSTAAREVWGPAADWLAARSGPKPARKRAAKNKPGALQLGLQAVDEASSSAVTASTSFKVRTAMNKASASG